MANYTIHCPSIPIKNGTCGEVTVMENTKLEYEKYLIHSLYVDPRGRRKGIGNILIRDAELFILCHGCNVSYLYVIDNSWMHEWFKRLGYVDTDEDAGIGFIKMKKKLK